MQSGQVSEEKSYENQNADLERILKNITESSTFHSYEKIKLLWFMREDLDVLIENSAEYNLSCILIKALYTENLKFIHYILESLEVHSKTILNIPHKTHDYPIFKVISAPWDGNQPRYTKRSIQNKKDILSLLLRYGAEIHVRATRMDIHPEWTGTSLIHGSLAFQAMLAGNVELLKYILDKCRHMSKEEREDMVHALYQGKRWSIIGTMIEMSLYLRDNALEMAAQLFEFYPESFRLQDDMWSGWNQILPDDIHDLYFYIHFTMSDSIQLVSEQCFSQVKKKEAFMESIKKAEYLFNCVTGFKGININTEKLMQFLNGTPRGDQNKYSMNPALAISHMPPKAAAQFLKNIFATQDEEIIFKAINIFKKHQNYNKIIEIIADSICHFIASQNDEKLNAYLRTVNLIIDQFYILRWQAESKESLDGSNARLNDLGSLIAKMIFMASARYEELDSDYLLNLKALLRSYIRMGGHPENVVFGEWESNNQLKAIHKNFSSRVPEAWVERLSRIPDELYFSMFYTNQLNSLICYLDQIKLAAVTNGYMCEKIESFSNLLHDQNKRPDGVLWDASESWGALRETLERYVASTKGSHVSFFKGTEDNIALALEAIDIIFAHYQAKKSAQQLLH